MTQDKRDPVEIFLEDQSLKQTEAYMKRGRQFEAVAVRGDVGRQQRGRTGGAEREADVASGEHLGSHPTVIAIGRINDEQAVQGRCQRRHPRFEA